MDEPTVVKMRTGQFEWRMGDSMDFRLDGLDSTTLAVTALTALSWTSGTQLGLLLPDGEELLMRDERQLRDEQERRRARGQSEGSTVHRRALYERWRSEGVVAKAKPAWASPEPAVSKKAARVTRAAERQGNDFTITTTLFDDPEEQLRYEVRHAYLMTVPPNQRSQWPFQEDYKIFDTFMVDVLEQESYLSRRQIVSVVMDVVCGKAADTPSRGVRFMNEGGIGNPNPLIRRDQARGLRAKVSQGTSARRIMWWRTAAGGIELARLAVHDDVYFPDN